MKPTILRRTLAAAAVLALTAPALAQSLPTETFDDAPLSNAGYSSGVVPGTALEVTSGIVAIGSDPVSGHGNYLDLFSGWYANDTDANGIGSSSVRSVASFDLLAGYQYTLAFDFSRQTFSAGNGPFETHLTGSLGSHAVTYDDVAGFYYGFDWTSGGLSWTQASDELGARVSFTAFGPAGYSGMLVDNISLVGLPPTVAPVPEPETFALLLAGLGAIGSLRMRRKRS